MLMGNKDSFDLPDIALDLLKPLTDLLAADAGINQESIRPQPDEKNIAVRTAGKTT
jgi:hypothetical protein